MSVKGRLRLGTVFEACKVIGGESKPVHPSTFYRGVKKGRYSPPIHPSENVSRVDLDRLEDEVRASADSEADTRP
jgi:hypothetical protein